MFEPQRDLIRETRELLSKATPRPWIVVDKGEYDPQLARELLRLLADEVERLQSGLRECLVCHNPMSVYCPRCVKDLP